MKVTRNPAVQNVGVTQTSPASTVDKGLAAPIDRNLLVPGRGHSCWCPPSRWCLPPFRPLFPPAEPGSTLKWSDRLTARRLSDVLSRKSPLMDTMRMALGKDVKLTTGKDGVVRGPEGEPLVKVQLKNGKTAYVDPNTNQYYLAPALPRGWFPLGGSGQTIQAKGPFTLPPEAQFSNSHFSDADVKTLTRDANWRPWPIIQPPWVKVLPQVGLPKQLVSITG
ncbi:MAG: hypothetical protein HYZ28_06395 [Myxococcales bacterium]|nr:hypothetical protein [Myxococcales bacterium]